MSLLVAIRIGKFNGISDVFLISIVIIDMISIVVSELDEISRPVYLSLITTKEKYVLVLQSINIVDSTFAIVEKLCHLTTIFFDGSVVLAIILVLLFLPYYLRN